MRREFAVQAGSHKRILQQIVCGLPIQRDVSLFVPRWEQRTVRVEITVSVAVPIHQFSDRKPTVHVDRHCTAGLFAFDDRLVEKEIGYRLAVLVHITDA